MVQENPDYSNPLVSIPQRAIIRSLEYTIGIIRQSINEISACADAPAKAETLSVMKTALKDLKDIQSKHTF
ncbi:hypothetical protein [Paraburkholderia sp. C35]|uniref:hypothetical protein n=1 Tax=Paraburkholderia sp. C35 TaxID=2126993 RepID=UPI000D68AD7B|nr:hypothetical protein [Paraburkholderia sp. C35]